jgi:hypothetical protein
MAVTTFVITGNVCMSRHWKAESVTYEICKQLSPRFMHILPLKPDRSSVCLVCPESFQHHVLTSKSHTGIDRMSNQRKSEFVNGNFGIQRFWEVMTKFYQSPDLDRKIESA